VLLLGVLLGIPVTAVATAGEPCLLAYPTGQTVFRFDPVRYEVVGSNSSKYNPAYEVAGQTLWDRVEERVAVEIYQAPGLYGFEESTDSRSEYHQLGSRGTLIVDGFSASPRQYSDIIVQFTPRPAEAQVSINVNGSPVVGLRHVIPYLVVSTPNGDGYYSDAVVLTVDWSGTLEMEVMVYADRNGNRIFDGEPIYRLLMEDHSVPTENATWGSIKSLYAE
jgi:hypothetical protein